MRIEIYFSIWGRIKASVFRFDENILLHPCLTPQYSVGNAQSSAGQVACKNSDTEGLTSIACVETHCFKINTQ